MFKRFYSAFHIQLQPSFFNHLLKNHKSPFSGFQVKLSLIY
ncbi:hypothetical protein HPCPY3281_1098 [Helicobacter pylori CPY3281]|nr:hypothetical protein HPCPY3281_1098 [Helicobacter pylori CPY3281]